MLSGVGLPASFQLLTSENKKISGDDRIRPDKLITIIYFAISGFLLLTILKLLFFRFHVKKGYGIFLIVTYILLIIFTLLVEWKFIGMEFLANFGFSAR